MICSALLLLCILYAHDVCVWLLLPIDMDLKAKQDYLFTEILEANYDPEVFQEYIEKRKGVNLDNYTMEELIDIVQSFKGNDKDK